MTNISDISDVLRSAEELENPTVAKPKRTRGPAASKKVNIINPITVDVDKTAMKAGKIISTSNDLVAARLLMLNSDIIDPQEHAKIEASLKLTQEQQLILGRPIAEIAARNAQNAVGKTIGAVVEFGEPLTVLIPLFMNYASIANELRLRRIAIEKGVINGI